MSIFTQSLKQSDTFRELLQAIGGGALPAAVTGLGHIHKVFYAHALAESTGRRLLFLTGDEAEAYRVARLQQAEGESRRFDALRQEYEKAPDVTRQRLYYEAMEEILAASKDKTLLDSGVSGKVLPHMPLPGTPAFGVLPSEKK